jgi:hypothetical protein
MPNTVRPYSLEIKKRFITAVETVTKELYPGKREVDVIKALGFAPSNFYRMRLVDNSYPTLDHCAALCTLYNISEQWLISGLGTMKKELDNNSPIEALKQAVYGIESELNRLKYGSKSG